MIVFCVLVALFEIANGAYYGDYGEDKVTYVECPSQELYMCLNATHYKFCKKLSVNRIDYQTFSCPFLKCCQPGRKSPCTLDCPKAFYNPHFQKQRTSMFNRVQLPEVPSGNPVMSVKTIVVRRNDMDDNEESINWAPSYRRCCENDKDSALISHARIKRSMYPRRSRIRACPNGFVRNRFPLNCEYYYQCVYELRTVRMLVRRCSANFYFNQESMTCMEESNVVCLIEKSPAAKFNKIAYSKGIHIYSCVNDSQILEDTLSCNSHYVCHARAETPNVFELRRQYCVPDHYFDADSLTCKPGTCSKTLPLYRIVGQADCRDFYRYNKDAIMIKMQHTCDSYKVCTGFNGIYVYMFHKCPAGTVFDQDIETCRPPDKFINCGYEVPAFINNRSDSRNQSEIESVTDEYFTERATLEEQNNAKTVIKTTTAETPSLGLLFDLLKVPSESDYPNLDSSVSESSIKHLFANSSMAPGTIASTRLYSKYKTDISLCFQDSVTMLKTDYNYTTYYDCIKIGATVGIVLRQCPNGLAFDFERQMCRVMKNVDYLTLGTKETAPPADAHCDVQVTRLKSFNSCRSYYECKRRNEDSFYAVARNCPDGMLFDDGLQRCRSNNFVTCH